LAEKAWLQVIAVEKEPPLAAQAHFGLASVYRKEGKQTKAESELQEFRKVQKMIPQSKDRPK
jgi:hypothetical protein